MRKEKLRSEKEMLVYISRKVKKKKVENVRTMRDGKTQEFDHAKEK